MLASHAYNFISNNLLPISKGNYLEIGVWNGQGISFLANKYKNKKFYGIDPFIEDGNTSHISNVKKEEQLTLIKELALLNTAFNSNVTLFVETSENFYNRMQEKDLFAMDVDTIFIDGNHSTSAVVIDYSLGMTILKKKKGTIIFDDLQVKDVEIAVNMFEKQFSSVIKNSQEITNTCKCFQIDHDL